MPQHDVVIIGGGPAGLTAAMYLCRAAVGATVYRTPSPPSQIILTTMLENYPGIDSIDGFSFVEALSAQARKFGADIVEKAVAGVQKAENGFIVSLEDGEAVSARAVIVASGSRPRTLGVPGEKEFTGRGVSYCGTCDGVFFRGKNVLVVGGGDTAADDGILLSRLASHVYLVHRRDRMRADPSLARKFLSAKNVEPLWEHAVEAVRGGDAVSSVAVKNLKTGDTRDIAVDGVFVFAGGEPNTDMIKHLVETDEAGYVVTDQRMASSQRGVFAAGDCRKKAWRQVVTACGDGAEAAYSVQRYIEALEGRSYPGRGLA